MVTEGRKTSPTHWEAPSMNFFKLNFDGASKGNPGPAGYSAVIRNSDREILHILAGSMGHNTNNAVKIWSLLCGLQAASEQDLFPLITKGDSQIVIKLLSHLLNGADPENLSPSW
jgi:ribonuclease HI